MTIRFEKAPNNTLVYEELEPRVLFSADVVPGLDISVVEQPAAVEAVSTDASTNKPEAENPTDQPVFTDNLPLAETDDATAKPDVAHSTQNAEPENEPETDAVDQETTPSQPLASNTAAANPDPPAGESDSVGTDSTADAEAAANADCDLEDASGPLADEQKADAEIFAEDPRDDAIVSEEPDQPTDESRTELTFINENVADADQLIADLAREDDGRDMETVVLDADRDGIEQVTEILAERQDLSAVHFVTHGSEGQMSLGSSWLNHSTLEKNSEAIAAWGQSLTEDGDILFYGCNMAASEDGQSLAETLADMTGADVTASDGLTGSPTLGGNWTLEYATGAIETKVFISQNAQLSWNRLLDITSGLIGHWTFDSNAADASISGFDGTLAGDATIDTTPSNPAVGSGALSLDGINDYVELSSHAATLGTLAEGTIAGWINTSDTVNTQTLFGVADHSDMLSFASFGVYQGKLFFDVAEQSSGGYIFSVLSNDVVADGSWHHVAVTVDATGNSLYLDGAQISLADLNYFYGGSSSSAIFLDEVNSVDAVQIGVTGESGGYAYDFSGSIDDVRVYNRALSSSDMKELYIETLYNDGIAIWAEAGASTPESSHWNGISFDAEAPTSNIGQWKIVQGAEAPSREEAILVGVTTGGDITGMTWDGSDWNPLSLGTLGTVSETYWWGADVAYESQSGNAVVVWNDNSQSVGDKLRYSVWDGSNWTSPVSIADYTGNEPQQLKLAANPTSDEMILAVSDSQADDHVLIWDGSAWGNAQMIDSSGTGENDQSGISVAYESTSGHAMVAYGHDGDANLYYRTWDGSNLSSEASLSPPGGVTSQTSWTSLASDPNSDRIAVSVLTSGGSSADVWLSVWDGGAWESPVLAETSATGSIFPNASVAFESESGNALAVYGQNGQSAVRYRTWSAGSGWSTEQIGPNVGDTPNSLTLDSDPSSDAIMLSVQDSDSDLNMVLWNESTWGTPKVHETNTGDVKNQPFVFLWDQNDSATNDAPTFGLGDGSVLTDFAGGDDEAQSVAIQSDGKTIVAGYVDSGGFKDFALVRYNTDGTLDSSFGTNGRVTVDSGILDYGRSVTVQSDGKIILAGETFGADFDFALLRFNADGSLDNDFGTNGQVTTDFGSQDMGQDVALQNDGRIVVAGYSNAGGNYDFALARYNSDGSLDNGFGTNGKVTTDIGSGTQYAYGVALQNNGQILVSGTSDNDFALFRYNDDGSLDNGFGVNGKVVTDFTAGTNDVAYDIAVQDDGMILVAGITGSTPDIALARYDTLGNLDNTFGTNGKVTTPVGSFSDIGQGVVVQDDGKVLVSGYFSNGSQNEAVIIRYLNNGTMDSGFGTGGIANALAGNNGGFYRGLALHENGSIVAAGFDSTGGSMEFALVQFNSDGTLATTFDDDGSGILSASPNYVEDASPVILDSDVTIFDAELSTADEYSGAILTLQRTDSANPEDVFSATGNLDPLTEGGKLILSGVSIATVNINSGGTLQITFDTNSTQARVNETLQSIAYANTSDAPPASVQIDWTFNDGNAGAQGSGGALEATGSVTVTITANNDDPTNAGTLPTDIAVTEDVASNFDLSSIDISDVDANGGNLSIRLTTSTGGVLTGATAAGIILGNNGTSQITLNGTQADLNTYLNNPANIQYLHATANTAGNDADSVQVSVSDLGNTGVGGGGHIDLGTVNVDITTVNDAPELLTGSVDNLTVDEDSGLTSLGLGSVTYGPGGGTDESGQNLTYDVSVIPDPANFGKIYLANGTTQVTTGSYTLAEIQGMQFSPNENENGTSFFQFNVTDDGGTANGGSDTTGQSIMITGNAVDDAPIIITTGSVLAYNEGDGAVVVDSGLTVEEVEGENITGAIVSIIGGFASSEDSLDFTDQLGISGSYDVGTGILTLTGATSAANYQTALRTITYANGSEMPSTTNRTVSFQVSEGASSANASRTISITSLNDDPAAGPLPTDVTVTEDVSSGIDLTGVTVSDVDADNQLLTMTLATSTGGRLYAGSDLDVVVFGSGTGTLTLQGGVADLNNFLSSASRIQYLHDTAHTNGDNADTIQATINDNGNTGSGGSGNINLGTVNVDITPVNDAPVAVADSFTVNEGATTNLDLAANDTDVDDGLDLTSIAIVAGPANGSVVVNNDGTVDYTHDGTETIADSFTYTIDDLAGETSNTVTVDLTVTPVNDAPEITSNGGNDTANLNVEENSTAVTTVIATDAEADTPTYSITGGTDQLLFDIDTNSGNLTFKAAPDFENAGDSNTDNIYVVEVTADDGNGGTDTQTINVRVVEVAEGIRVTPTSLVPIGTETLVNTETSDIQLVGANVAQAIAMDANGNYVVVWGSNLQDGEGWGIYAQRFGADGTAQGGEIAINTTTGDHQLNPTVAMDDAGNFVVSWQSNLQDGSSYGVYSRHFNAAGLPQGGEVLVNSTTDDYQGSPGIAMAPNGDHVIIWTANAQDPDVSLGIYGQVYSAGGTPQGSEFRINTYTDDTQQVSSVSMDDAGNFVVTWGSENQDGSNYGVFGQIFDNNGVAYGSEFQVNTTTDYSQLYNDVVMLPDGRFAVAYQSVNADTSTELFIQRFNADGSKLGSEIHVNAASDINYFPIPSITGDDSGNLTVVWNNSNDGDGNGVFARSYDWSGTALTGEIKVNTTTAGNQTYPEVMAQPGGGFVVVWGGNGTGDADGVFMQRYGLTTTEDGGSTAIEVVLESAPTADVVIPISVSDGSEISTSAGSLTFTNGDWSIPQTVTITGLQDFIADGTQICTVILGPATSADSNFDGLDPADLIVTNMEVAVPPDITSDGGGATANIDVAEDTTAVTTVTAIDANEDTVTFSITGGVDQAHFDIDTNSGVLTFRTAPDFENPTDSDTDNTYVVEITADDGNGGTDVQTINVNVTPVNEPSVLTLSDTGAMAYTENDSATAIISQLSIADPDDTQIESATVQISANYVNGEDVLAFGDTANISGSWDADTGMLTLSGTDSLTNYRDALEAVTYQNTSEAPSTLNRTVDFSVHDGDDQSNTVQRDISITAINDAPTATIVPTGYGVDEDDGYRLFGGFSISDPDVGTNALSVSLDVNDGRINLATTTGLTFTGGSNASASMTFTGTVADINSALATLSYRPDADFAGSDNVVLFVDDQGNSGGPAENHSDTASISVAPINDDPTNEGSLPSDISVTEDVSSDFDLSALDIIDVDANGNNLSIRLTTSTGGILTGTAAAGIVFGNNGTSQITLNGTQADLNAYLNNPANIQYVHGTPDTAGDNADTVQISVNDLGNTGAGGGGDISLGTVNVDITPVNDAPIAVADSFTVNEGSTTNLDLAVNDTDADDGLDLTSIAIVAGPANGSIVVNNDGTVDYTHDGTETVADSFTYTIDDLAGETSNTVTVNLTVTPVNDAPVAVADSFTVDEASTTNLNLAANDSDADDGLDLTSIDIVAGPANGSIIVNNDGTVDYTHDGTETVADSFTYTINDLAGETSNTVTVDLTVTPVNDAPIAVADVFTVNEGSTTNLDLAANDTDADDGLDLTSIAIVAGPANGSIVVNNDGTVDYTHDGNETIADSFTYTIDDLAGETSNTVTVDLTVTPANDAPVAVADSFTVDEASTTNLDLAANDTDADDGLDLTSIAIVAGPANGSVVVNNDGTVDYTHDGTETVADSFTYTIDDLVGETSNTVTVDLTVTPVNDVPVAVADTFTINEGSTTNLDLATNDTDADDGLDLASIAIVAGPANGSVVVNNDGTVDYTHDGTETVADSFTYTIDDLTGVTSNTVTVDLTVTPVNDVPVAVADTFTINEGSTTNLDLATNDTDADDGLDLTSIAIVAGPANGSVVVNNDGTVDYTHDGTETVADSFTYTIDDLAGETSNTVTVDLTVTPVNDAPVAVADTFTVDEGTTTNLDLATNDSDADDGLDLTSITIVAGPANGSIVVNNDGTVDYTHDGSETVADTFTYTIDDLAGETSNTVSVNLNVTPVNDAPIAIADVFTVNEASTTNLDLAANDTDADDGLDLTSIAIVAGPANGSVVVNNDGTVDYTHDGTETVADSFTYTIDDLAGETSNTVTVSLTVTPVNDAPVAVADSFTVNEGSTTNLNLAANDNDADDGLDLTSITIVAGPANGSVVVNNDGTVDYTHDGTETVADSFTYTIDDLAGETSNTVTVDLTVTPINDAPVAVADTFTVDEGTTTNLDLATNDTDADDGLDLASIAIVAGPANGSVVVNNDGTVDYTHDGSETVADSFTYTIDDLAGETSNTVTVDLNINPVNDAPVASDMDINTIEDIVYTDILPAGMDPDGDPLVYYLETNASKGSATIQSDGNFRYSPYRNAYGSDSFSYRITDNLGGQSIHTVNVDIAAVDDAPIVADVNLGRIDDDNAFTIDQSALLTGCSDVEGDSLSAIHLRINSGRGHLVNNHNGTWTYYPELGWEGSVKFDYEVTAAGASTGNNASLSIPPADVPHDSGFDPEDDQPENSLPPESADNPQDSDPTASVIDSGGPMPSNSDSDWLAETDRSNPEDNGSAIIGQQNEIIAGIVDMNPMPETVTFDEGRAIHESSADFKLASKYRDPGVVYLKDGNESDPSKIRRSAIDDYYYIENAGSQPFLASNHPLWTAPSSNDTPEMVDINDYSNIDFSATQKINGLEYDLLRDEINKSFDSQQRANMFKTNVITTATATITAGIVSYILRIGSMFSGMISTLPVWRSMDPIAILPGSKDDKKGAKKKSFQTGKDSEVFFDKDSA